MEEPIYDAEFRASLGTLYASRARLHAIFNVAETQRPTFLTGSILAFTLELSPLLGRSLCFRKSTVPVRPWKRPDCVG